MKFKTTKKELKENYHYIISIGYCDAQFLLQYHNPQSYCTRVEGWACDNYDIDGTLISTGYSPLQSKNTVRDYVLVKAYDNKAREIINNHDLNWEEQKAEVDKLLKEYIVEVRIRED